ncbi:OmpA family protein [Burkholderia dolosa]|uniref:OmpA family protein n=1 Tax=Burkholderia dolosa TaxID=152500 RepID=UPI00159248FF|nr:OmpA family protein [Burkholderia dolosa]MBR8460477.1 OmpA family protein [Burkholderia dolosa]
MNKLALALALAAGQAYSTTEPQPRDGVHMCEVPCIGLLSGRQTARNVCSDELVDMVNSPYTLHDGLGLATPAFEYGAAPVGPASDAEPASDVVAQRNLLGYALFATDHATLTPHARESLNGLLSEREDRTYSQVTVTGFTDSVGSSDYNCALSRRRAEAVAAYLKEYGLKAGTLTVAGCGMADPVASNATVEGRASNRRVEILLQH